MWEEKGWVERGGGSTTKIQYKLFTYFMPSVLAAGHTTTFVFQSPEIDHFFADSSAIGVAVDTQHRLTLVNTRYSLNI